MAFYELLRVSDDYQLNTSPGINHEGYYQLILLIKWVVRPVQLGDRLGDRIAIIILNHCFYLLNYKAMAEEVGFEPTEELPLRRFSRPVHSTALSLLRVEY